MSQRLISRSGDLQKLRDEGYDLQVVNGFLLVRDVPYVDSNRDVRRGVLVSSLELANDVAVRPTDHVARFAGSAPCDKDGQKLDQIINSSNTETLAEGVTVDHVFSSKPEGGYENYHQKVTTYVNMLSGPAQAIDPDATAKTFPLVVDDGEDSVFRYLDTASSRAQIDAITDKLKLDSVAIVGLGGTGAYILDLVAKTPVRKIHIFDGDRFIQHNSFRSPSAASGEELEARPQKVGYFEARYSKMHKGIVPHDYYVDESNAEELRDMIFVFLALDTGETKKILIKKLEEFGIPFVDVGMGLYEAEGWLGGTLRVTTSTNEQRAHVWDSQRIPFSDGDENNEYARNIQVADLNALNAALAVVRWKKYFGFYADLEREHFSVYEIDGNHILNEDRSEAQ